MIQENLTLPQILDGEDKSSPFKNCIKNNYRHLRKWARRTLTDCFRIYDRELASYPIAIDFYSGRFSVNYYAKGRDHPEPPKELVLEVSKALFEIFGAEENLIYWRTRIRSKETRQYEKAGEFKEFFTALEYGVKFLINLRDYLDTGLFLDHRETRKLVASQAKGKSLLNLFAYTCSFSVQAAASGAVFTKSVDMSNTYTEWGKENFQLNGFSLKNHKIVRADCLKFLDEEIRDGLLYDLIVIDPPTISRSKKMDQLFDIQEDYIILISKSLDLLNREGKIFFSTNSRKFIFDLSLFPNCSIKELTDKTIPIDFQDRKIHRVWEILKKSN